MLLSQRPSRYPWDRYRSPEFRDDFRRMMETIKGTMEALIDCVELLEKDSVRHEEGP